MPSKATSNGTTCSNGSFGAEGPEATETDSSGTGGMRQSMERKGSAPHDAIHLQRRVGLFSGVALIVGTMIGEYKINTKIYYIHLYIYIFYLFYLLPCTPHSYIDALIVCCNFIFYCLQFGQGSSNFLTSFANIY